MNMTLEEFNEHLSYYFSTKLHEIYEKTETGEYQREQINNFKKKYSFFDRVVNIQPEEDFIKLCKKSLSNNFMASEEAKEKIRENLIQKLKREIELKKANFRCRYFRRIRIKSRIYAPAVIKNIVDKCIDKMEKQYLKIRQCKSDFTTNYTIVTETVIEFACNQDGMFIPLKSLGLNPITDRFEQAGLAVAILKEIAERYKQKYHDDLHVVFSSESRVNPKAVLDSRHIKEGYYRESSTYICIALGNDSKRKRGNKNG